MPTPSVTQIKSPNSKTKSTSSNVHNLIHMTTKTKTKPNPDSIQMKRGSQIILPILSSLPTSTTSQLTKSLLQQYWAESILCKFIRRYKLKKNPIHQGHDITTPVITTSNIYKHFLFDNLHSNILMIRQSCIITLLKGIEDDDKDNNSNVDNETKSDHQTSKQKEKKWNYKLILRNVIWNLIQNDYQSFLHLFQYAPSSMHNVNNNKNEDDNDKGRHNKCQSKGIIQLIGLFIYLLEDSEDDVDERCLYYVNEDSEGIKTPMKDDDKTTTTTTSATTISETDGKSPLYQFVIKGGLKWISSMILQLIQLLLSYNENVDIQNHSNLLLQQQQHQPVHDKSILNVDERSVDDSDDEDNIIKFSSPSTLNKPRHYFYSLKQSSSSTFAASSNYNHHYSYQPTLQNDILIRLSLLIDLLTRVSLVGYIYEEKNNIDMDNKDESDTVNNSSETTGLSGSKVRKQLNRKSSGDNETTTVAAAESTRNDAISSFLKSIMSSQNAYNETPFSLLGSPQNSIPGGDPSNSTSNNLPTTITKKYPFEKVKSDKERQQNRTQILQTIHEYIWRQSNIDNVIQIVDNASKLVAATSTASLSTMSHTEAPMIMSKLSRQLSPLASLLSASFVLSTTIPPPAPQAATGGGSIVRSFPSLSLLTSTLIGDMLPLSSSNRTSGSALNSAVDTMTLFSIDYPILPGAIRIERIVSYLNKLIDPAKDVMVVIKSRVNMSMINNNKPKDQQKSEATFSTLGDVNGGVKRSSNFLSLNQGQNKRRSEDVGGGEIRALASLDGNPGGTGGKRRRLESGRISMPNNSRLLPLSSNGNGNSSERREIQREEEELSASSARAILRAVVSGGHIAERDTYNPFSMSLERNAHKNFAEIMARDMVENLLDEHDDIEDENEGDDDCMVDNDAHDEEDDEEDEDDDEIDSDLEESNKPLLDEMQDIVDDENNDHYPIDVNEEDIMLVDGFDNVRSLRSSDHILANLIGESSLSMRQRNGSNTSGGSGGSVATTNLSKSKSSDWREKIYIRAGMEILELQHHAIAPNLSDKLHISRKNEWLSRRHKLLTPTAEQLLIQSICNVVKPPKKPLNLKVFMRRAPTQEEFFRGNISRNPILISSLKVEQGASSSELEENSTDRNEPRVRDLRQHIANDLQMGDSAELLELLVANKILDMNLRLRVVCQTLWKTYLIENPSNFQSQSSSIRHLISGFEFGSRSRIDENTPASSLPPMVVTYRLAGVDGEATEDNVELGDLVDPEAPPDIGSSQVEYEKKMDEEFGLTRLVTKGRGIHILLRSIEGYLETVMQNIRRDDVGRRRYLNGTEFVNKNPSRDRFLKSFPCSALTLLRHCARLKDNRKKLVNAKAPTILLRLLLEVLNSIDVSTTKENEGSSLKPLNDTRDENAGRPSETINVTPKKYSRIGNNPTADMLQELIETLASDISTTDSKISNVKNTNTTDLESLDEVSDNFDESTSLTMVLSSLTTTTLSPPLRKVISKLLPFLTYGQVQQSKALACHFVTHIEFESLGLFDSNQTGVGDSKTVLMSTFVDAAIHLPPVAVCDTLRSELIKEGFIVKLKKFLLRDLPSTAPPWSAALFSKDENLAEKSKQETVTIDNGWRRYYERPGLNIGFQILIGLCKEHVDTQAHVAESLEANLYKTPFLTACHWIESTSDKLSDDISTNGLGILAETLLDTLCKDNEECEVKIKQLRKRTRNRKMELAQERRSKALVGMISFGRLVGDGAEFKPNADNDRNTTIHKTFSESESGEENKRTKSCNTNSVAQAGRDTDKRNLIDSSKPAWMLEMEAMEDEIGLTCAVCQEGRTLQPTELLGLYAYIKKVSIPFNKGGMLGNIDGALLLLSLPYSLPTTLLGTDIEDDWFIPAKSAGKMIKTTSHGAMTLSSASSGIMSSRSTNFLTTVTAGNAIHCTCHSRARAADRNHPKAPKSEWEGASLRNSRVTCNAILPLVSQQNAKVPVMSLENALADHHTAVSNILGSQPKSMLWTMLHDIRLLLLRISYGESLNADCGGGSLASNSALIYYMLFMSELLSKDAALDSPSTVQHAKQLTPGFLAASSILRASDYKEENITSQRMHRGLVDAAPMVSICCVLFHNDPSNNDSQPPSKISPNPKRIWELHKDHFLCGFIRCAGKRYALGIDDSGCESSRGSITGRRIRSTSFNEWDLPSDEHIRIGRHTGGGNRGASSVEEYAAALRPMITFFAMIDQISKDFSISMEDEIVEESAERLVHVIEGCQKASDIRSLLSTAKVSLNDSKILEEFNAGVNIVQ